MVVGYGSHERELRRVCKDMTFTPVNEGGFKDIFSMITDFSGEYLLCYDSDDVSTDEGEYYYLLYEMNIRGYDIKCLNCKFEGEEYIRKAAAASRTKYRERNLVIRSSKDTSYKVNKGRTPYGYKVVGHKTVVNEEEARVVRRMFELVDTGISLAAIAKTLDSEGYVGKNGKTITSSIVNRWIGNKPFYEGYKKVNEKWVESTHPKILG